MEDVSLWNSCIDSLGINSATVYWVLHACMHTRAVQSNIFVEMIKFAGTAFQNVLLSFYNDIINQAEIPENWHVTIFSMLPKSGNLECPSNWRPIAILPILYKIFAKMLYYRLYPILDAWQADDKFGFRKNKGSMMYLLFWKT